jgi:hypothetical protein
MKAPPRATATRFLLLHSVNTAHAGYSNVRGQSVLPDLPAYRFDLNRFKDARCLQFSERKERANARRLFSCSTKSASPRPAVRRPSVFTTDGGNKITLYDHIQELRAELRGCRFSKRERAAVEAELAKALAEQAKIERNFDRAVEAYCQAEATHSRR